MVDGTYMKHRYTQQQGRSYIFELADSYFRSSMSREELDGPDVVAG